MGERRLNSFLCLSEALEHVLSLYRRGGEDESLRLKFENGLD